MTRLDPHQRKPAQMLLAAECCMSDDRLVIWCLHNPVRRVFGYGLDQDFAFHRRMMKEAAERLVWC